ncbi:restriction endonuclease [Luteibacter jiangsuensis]|uniref:Restriction endonuclease n=1 Tax=Luteibacter jiangsuensis TaxID=637577 RepID=A0ABX0Q9T7_9GAMM|nr:restriction endonuclease [Luteibacter jiangsuensis]NID05923.1 restriction endonuclease [Luteibacter jiangsuensis]
MFSARPPSPAGTDALARLSWHDFEHLLAEYYRDQGWRVEYHAPPASLKQLDGAFDLRLHRGNETVIVQCKHWDAVQVELQEVNELLGTMLHEAATRGILVTRGGYSAEARAVPRRQPRLQLIDGDILRVMLKLQDQRDTSIPGVALPTVEARKSGKVRRASDGTGSRLLPLLLVVVIAVLLGIFIWRAMSRRAEPAPMPADTSSSASSASPPVVAVPTQPPPPPPTATAPAAVPRGVPSATRELEERARLRGTSESAPSHESRRKAEDAIKVMERNTREVGSAE